MPLPTNSELISEYIYKLHKRVNNSIEGKEKSDITFAETKEIYRRAVHNEKEWIFIEAIVAIHSGKYHVTEEFIKSLKIFLAIYIQYTDSLSVVPSNLNSKIVIKDWIRKNKKRGLTKFKECV